MVRSFYLLVAILILAISLVSISYLNSKRYKILNAQRDLVALTKLDSLYFSVEYYEPRIRRFEPSINIAYPELLTLDRLNFVYGKLYEK